MGLFSFDVPWLGALGGMLNRLVKLRATFWAAKAIGSLGLGFGSKALLLDPLMDQAVNSWHAVPALAANWAHALGIDTAVSIVLSAYGMQSLAKVFLVKANEARDQ